MYIQNSNNIVPKEELLISFIQGKTTDSESRIINDWLNADVKNEKALMQLAKIYFANYKKERIQQRNTDVAYNVLKRKIGKRKTHKNLKRTFLFAACFISILSLLSTTYLLINKTKTLENIALSNEYTHVTIESKIGMRSSFYLPDGSFVYLNSGSKITYPVAFNEQERRISLSGEAYFKVESNPDYPFYVDLSDKDVSIKVLGTEFNLEAYKDNEEIRTTLLSGKLSVLPSVGDTQKEYELHPQQKALFNIKTELWSVINTDGKEDIAWMEGKLIFRETPMPEVLRRLSLFYDVDFRVQNKVIEKYRFTGVFDNRQLVQILDYLKISSSIDYTVKQFTPREEKIKKRTLITLRII